MQLLYILLCTFYGNFYVYLCAFIPMGEFLYDVNVFIPMRLFYGLMLLKMEFLFGVNAYAFISMMLCIVKNC